MRNVILAAALAGFAAIAAAAQTPATPPPSSAVVANVNGWRILDNRGTCSADTRYEGSIIINLSYDVANNSAWLIVHNPAWEAIRDEQSYSVSLSFSNGSVYGDTRARGFRTDDEHGRVTALRMQLNGEDFLTDFAGAARFEMTMGGVRLGILSLRGTRAVALRLSQCSAAGFRRYPPGPFRNVPAPPASSPRSGVGAARGRANLASYVSNADYPASAIRAGEQGTVAFSLIVGADGRVADCRITSSSGSEALDSATCRIMQSRPRFAPARDAAGRPTTDTTTGRIRWVLPSRRTPPVERRRHRGRASSSGR